MDSFTATELAYKNGYSAALKEHGNCCQSVSSSWISVEERLPEPDVPVLAVLNARNGEPFVDTVMWNICKVMRDGVTHWMPLPEPPKEEI